MDAWVAFDSDGSACIPYAAQLYPDENHGEQESVR